MRETGFRADGGSFCFQLGREGWGREDGGREGGVGERGSTQRIMGEGASPPGPPGILYSTGLLRPGSQFKSNNFGLQVASRLPRSNSIIL